MNFTFYDSFLGSEFSDVKLNFINGDGKEDLQNNLKSQPLDWYYRDREIIYAHNTLGHRSTYLKDLNFDDYILFAGCSNTYGLGLELEQTYAYKVAKKLQIDYYNLSLPSSGLDVLSYNLLTWLTRFPKPKHLFIQWPDESRFVQKDHCTPNLYHSVGVWTTDKDAAKFMVLGDLLTYWRTRAELFYNLIKQQLDQYNIGGTFVSFVLDGTKVEIPENIIYPAALDKARDLIHYGNNTNDDLYNKIINSLDNKLDYISR